MKKSDHPEEFETFDVVTETTDDAIEFLKLLFFRELEKPAEERDKRIIKFAEESLREKFRYEQSMNEKIQNSLIKEKANNNYRKFIFTSIFIGLVVLIVITSCIYAFLKDKIDILERFFIILVATAGGYGMGKYRGKNDIKSPTAD